MRIKEITEYVRKYVHPDVEKQLQKYERRATGRVRMGHSPGFMSYPYRVEAKNWSSKYKKSINCANPKGFSQKAHCAGRKKKEDIEENFADKKVKGKSRPGRVKRSGASCKGSVTSLRAKARKYSGERGKMYHWCANMKGGKKKK